MNREQKRKKIKEIQKKIGLTREKAKYIVDQKMNTKIHLSEGTKVKLNYSTIISDPNWEDLNPLYKKFIEDHRNEEFTVEWDVKKKANDNKNKDILVCLKEDNSKPKWLFYTSDLTII